MAKQRLKPKSKARPSRPPAPVRPGPQTQPVPPPGPASPAPRSSQVEPSQKRSAYLEAVAVYERGVEALQRHDYPSAIELLESVLRLYPDEKELHERVRLYLNICRRQSTPPEAAPRTIDERLYAATLAMNGGQFDEALRHLHLVRDEDPDNDHALYMLAVAHAQRGEHAEALVHLERAIALNPENRALARRDTDLEPLREDEAFRHAVESVPEIRPERDRKRPSRVKSAR